MIQITDLTQRCLNHTFDSAAAATDCPAVSRFKGGSWYSTITRSSSNPGEAPEAVTVTCEDHHHLAYNQRGEMRSLCEQSGGCSHEDLRFRLSCIQSNGANIARASPDVETEHLKRRVDVWSTNIAAAPQALFGPVRSGGGGVRQLRPASFPEPAGESQGAFPIGGVSKRRRGLSLQSNQNKLDVCTETSVTRVREQSRSSTEWSHRPRPEPPAETRQGLSGGLWFPASRKSPCNSF
ncbi:unnamed protein product [Pleuronectes platessa]|uniref:Uncharacterized protein n=1 Tax=Pleuronectes platessa TaxID=8262 RepID=A0A9N7Z418_PLEPL|nr:unnamed protein product [Pleuronectes platessa]